MAFIFSIMFHFLKEVVHVDGMSQYLCTADTNRPFVHPPNSMCMEGEGGMIMTEETRRTKFGNWCWR
jgi:hypothetical protein